MTILYIDVSHHDWDRRGGQLDWAAVKAATSPVMCARATYGDPAGYHPASRHFGDFQTAAKAAGFVLRGGYHNLIKGDAASMARQVSWFRSELDRYGCQWAMVDVERYAELVSNGLWPRWADVLRFRDAWYAADSRPLVYYLPRWLVDSYYGAVDLDQLRGPLIQSRYPGGDGTAAQIYTAAGGDSGPGWRDVYGGRHPDIWQFTSGANVAGASSNTDVNAFRGTLAALTALFTGDDDVTHDEIVTAVLDALGKPPAGWDSDGVGRAAAAAGWAPPSMRALAEYAFEKLVLQNPATLAAILKEVSEDPAVPQVPPMSDEDADKLANRIVAKAAAKEAAADRARADVLDG